MGRNRIRFVPAFVAAALLSATNAPDGRPAGTIEHAASATSISTSAASEIGRNDATIRVTLSSTESGQWELDYGTSTSYGQSLGRLGFSPGTETMTFKLDRLEPGTTYHVRAVAQTPSFPPFTATYDSDDMSFTTEPAAKPTARVLSLQALADCACAVVKAGFGFGGLATRIHVEYGSTPRLGRSTSTKLLAAWMDVSGQGLAQSFDVPENGRLKPGGKYYLRVVAINKLGRAVSSTRSFTVPKHA